MYRLVFSYTRGYQNIGLHLKYQNVGREKAPVSLQKFNFPLHKLQIYSRYTNRRG
jgi:hypothetical protein